jgi:F-type H+-transporting ATPase subunit b
MKKFILIFCIGISINIGKAFGAEAGMPQLDPEYWLSQIFWLILIFTTLYLIIWKLFLPRITNNIENRRLRIINDLDDAQKLKENAEKKLKEYEKIIINSKSEAKKIFEDGFKNLENELIKKKQILDKELNTELEAIDKEIKDLKKSSVVNINKISVEIVSEIIKLTVGKEFNMSSVSATVQDISKKKIEKYL